MGVVEASTCLIIEGEVWGRVVEGANDDHGGLRAR